jgi:biopolymer transport protein ExbB
MLQEMTESGKVVTFPAQVTGKEGEAEERLVSRIGVFSAVAGGKYLQYSPETERLMELPRQPGSHYAGLAAKLDSTKKRIVPMMIDPTRGSIVNLLVQKPNLLERIQQGGVVGYIIIFIGCVGILLAFFRHFSLSRTAKGIENQLRNIGTPNSDNPLGRVLAVLKRMDKANPETLELSLDEAVLKEIPHLERGHALLKLLAAIAPLLGLLGTVIGMIITFQTITLFGTGDPKLMADGISQALVTTALGLLVTIPLLFAHSLVTARSKSLIQVLDQQSAGLIAARIEQHQGDERDRTSPILS